MNKQEIEAIFQAGYEVGRLAGRIEALERQVDRLTGRLEPKVVDADPPREAPVLLLPERIEVQSEDVPPAQPLWKRLLIHVMEVLA